MFKKILSIVLSLCIIISTYPIAYADNRTVESERNNDGSLNSGAPLNQGGDEITSSGTAQLGKAEKPISVKDNEQFNVFSSEFSIEMKQITAFFHPEYAQYLEKKLKDEIIDWDMDKVISRINELQSEQREKLYKYVPIAKNQYYYYTDRAQYLKDNQIPEDKEHAKEIEKIPTMKETEQSTRPSSKRSFLAAPSNNEKYTVTEFKNTYNYSVDTDELVDLTYRTSNRMATDLEIAGKPDLDIVLKRKYNSLDSKILKPELHIERGTSSKWFEQYGGNQANPFKDEDRKGFIATGWTLNIPSMEKSEIKAEITSWNEKVECGAVWNGTNECPVIRYGYKPLSNSYNKIVFTLENGISYEFHNNEIFNYPYKNVNLSTEKYNENGITKNYYYLIIDERIKYKFNDEGEIISKTNQYGDSVSYLFNKGKSYNDYNIVITDSYNRVIIIYRDSKFRITGFKYQDNGILVKEVSYNASETKTDLTYRKWMTSGYGNITDTVTYWKLNSVEEKINANQNRVLEAYNYYDVDASTVADFNFIVDSEYLTNDDGELLNITGGNIPNCYFSNYEERICYESRNIDWSNRTLYAEVPYLLLRDVKYNNGLTATFSYSKYDTTWSKQTNRYQGGVTRLFQDKYALEYISYHPVVRLDFRYNDLKDQNARTITNYYSNVHLENGVQVDEFWKTKKQDIPRLRKTSRFGDSQVIEVKQPTANGSYNSTYYHSSIINDRFLTDYIIVNNPVSYVMRSKDDNNKYSFKKNSITQFEYTQNQLKPTKISTYQSDFFGLKNVQVLMNPSLITDFTSKKSETYNYDTWGELVSQVDGLGNTITNEYNGPYHQISKSSLLEQGNVVSTTDYSYYSGNDANSSNRNNLWKTIETLSYKDTGDNNTSKTDVRTTEFTQYDSIHRKPAQIRTYSAGAQFGIEDNSNEKDIIYTDHGLIKKESTRVKLYDSATPTELTMQYDYYSNGSLKNITYPDGSAVSYIIDDQNRIISSTVKPPTGEAKTTNIAYDDGNRIVTIALPDGEKVEENYSPFGVKLDTNRIVNGVSRNITHNVSPNGRDVTEIYVGNRLQEKNEFDDNGRVIKRTNAIGQSIRSNYFNVVELPDGTQIPQDTVNSEYPDGKKETAYYDSNNRLIKLVEATPGRTKVRTKTMTYSPLGKLIMEKVESNGDSQTTHFGYDGSGNLIYLKNNIGEENRYVYNSLGQLLEVYTNKQKVKTVKHNELGWTLSEIDANGNKKGHQYKINGLVDKSTDKMGDITSYSYTPYNEVEKIQISDSRGYEKYWSKNTYDPKTRALVNQKNSEGESVSYRFDEWKRNNEKIIGDRKYTFEYDDLDRMVKLSYPGGDYSKYSYDDLNRIEAVSYKEGNSRELKVGSYSYSTEPNENTYTIGNSARHQVKRTNSFKEITSHQLITRINTPVVTFKETYNSDGLSNVTSIQRDGKTYSFSYDGLNRIEQERFPGGQVRYSYDNRGNRLTLESDNIIMESKANYDYNGLNQLKSVEKNDNYATYTYYGDGLRATKTVNKNKVRYVYVDGKIVEELQLDEKGDVVGLNARNIWGNELLYRKDFQNNRGGYYNYNGHGDVISIDDENREPIKSYEYDIWGNSTEVSSDPNKPFNNPFKYAGEVEDEESGLIFLRARYYDPSSGRFITEDTYEGQITNPLSLNLYTYVLNNPLSYVDPTGHYCQSTNGKYGHSGGCSDPKNASRYVPDNIYNANKGKPYDEIIRIYNRQKEQAVKKSEKIDGSPFTIVTGTAIPVPSAGGLAPLVNALVQAMGIAGALSLDSAPSTTSRPKNPTPIFRSGNGGNVNLTPRPGIDANGLSYFTKSGEGWKQVNATLVEAVKETGVFRVATDPRDPTHKFILAKDPYEHRIWMATRDGVKNGDEPYYLTKILSNITTRLK